MKHPKTEREIYYAILRSRHNLNISDVAEISGTSTKTVWRFEREQYKRASKGIKKVEEFYANLGQPQA